MASGRPVGARDLRTRSGSGAESAHLLAATDRSLTYEPLRPIRSLSQTGATQRPKEQGFAVETKAVDDPDVDETHPGPFEWDVKRLAAGVVIAGRANGFSAKEQNTLVRSCAQGYRERMQAFANMRTLDIRYAQDDADHLRELLASSSVEEESRRRSAEVAEKARTRTSTRAFAKLTTVTPEGRRIAADPPLITPLDQLLDDPSEAGREKFSVPITTGSDPPSARELEEEAGLVPAVSGLPSS